ncbi:MAG: Crp/Fnr family transcriptional regulator [Armatimonadetes bacterium]|nr:Crp/Fnr family transcriptional regulator [Armatimonadota bacterium]
MATASTKRNVCVAGPIGSDRPSVRSVVASCPVLRLMSDADINAITAASHLARAERGESIWLSLESAGYFCAVGSGFVKMVKTTAAGQEVAHEIMGPGQVFGLLGALEGSGCPLSARAVTDVWYLKIPIQVFRPIYERTEALSAHVMRRTTIRLRQAHLLVAQLSAGTVASRIAAILLMLAESYGQATEMGMVLTVPLTRQDISEMAGTTVESTIRVMSEWQKTGVIATHKKTITLLQEKRLNHLVQL